MRRAAAMPMPSRTRTRTPAIAFVLAVAVGLALAACNDLRDVRGAWQGVRVGDNPALRVGVATDATATLAVDGIDRHGLSATVTVPALIDGVRFASVPGAEADALAGLSFDGAPLRVYLGFVATVDGGGDALAMVALYDDDRLELRLLRGGTQPLYAIFALHR